MVQIHPYARRTKGKREGDEDQAESKLEGQAKQKTEYSDRKKM